MTTPEDQNSPRPADPPADAADSTAGSTADSTGDGAGDAAHERLEQAVRAAEGALIEFEIAVESFRIEVENFARLHEERLGPLHSRLEELDARIAEAVAARTGDPEDRRRAADARALLAPMPGVSALFGDWMDGDGMRPDAVDMLTERPVRTPPRVRPGEEARKLFRELIRRCHPDLVTDEREQQRRAAFVTRVNQAYARGDAEELRALTEEWAAGPPPPATPLARAEELLARLEWLAGRKEMLAGFVRELEAGAIGSMLRLAQDDPDGLLDEIAADLRRKIAEREETLARERAGSGGGG
ncbi:J domain-containing protein [Streptomyces aidingensis]|uniref:J domain-containing protein n=1 Tax=Streptomyces aidingensis TaxID=910347 RepID=A0A1I1QNG8_9ACTN|nr:J domain-containing protein [Streptomyces aidingensis]SFD23676.1 hypothetical protein SAMN05421773_111198 [Streptomyces aidingensis]